MIKTDVWMPFYTGDYTRATVDLTHAEHGAYLLTMIAYWDNGESLPDRRFRAICGKEFERVHEFYSMVDGRWHHKRIDEELEKARQRRRSAQEKALKGVVAKKLKHDSHNNDEKKDPQ